MEDLASIDELASVTIRLRQAGCVFAEDEARILIQVAQESTSNTGSSKECLGELLARRVAGDPLEQVVGWVEFAGLRLTVAPGVFVPRQRTTLLATQTIHAVRAAEARTGAGTRTRFLEAFCGVGPVATTVSRATPGAQIHLGDHDETALDCARTNVGAGVACHLLDCLAGLSPELARGFDVISAVPPYVPDSAAQLLPREALDYEEPTALFGGVDGLDLVRRLISQSRDWLAPEGTLLIELGTDQQQMAAKFARQAGLVIGASTCGEDKQTVVLELR